MSEDSVFIRPNWKQDLAQSIPVMGAQVMQRPANCGNFCSPCRKGGMGVGEDSYKVQTVVIGAGVVGLAVARELAGSGGGVIVVGAGAWCGEGTSSRHREGMH